MKRRLVQGALPIWSVPAALLAVCLLAYGWMVLKPGLFWDDWSIAWFVHFIDPTKLKDAFASDRPLFGWLTMLTTQLVGESPAMWQAFGLLARWLSCVAMWWALRAIWPDWPIQNAAATMLFAVYPGFLQQYIAISYSHHFIVLTLCLISMGAMARAIAVGSPGKSSRFIIWTGIALMTGGLSLFIMEYFATLELLRPVLLWVILSNSEKAAQESQGDARWRRVRRVAKYWAPYLLLDIVFLAWRLTSTTQRGEITLLQDLGGNPATAVIGMATTALQDLYETGALAWLKTLNLSGLSEYGSNASVYYGMIALGAAAVVVAWLALLRPAAKSVKDQNRAARRTWARQAIGVGLLALAAGGLLFWPTNLRIELAFPYDRFTLPMMFGAALLLAGIFQLIAWRSWVMIALTAATVALAAGLHYQNALAFRKDWLAQRDFFWQLVWRAPAIQPGTVLLTSELPFAYEWDNSLTTPVVWTYAPEHHQLELPYVMFNAESRLSRGVDELKEDTQIEEYLRTAYFKGPLSQSVVFFFRPPGSCLKVIDPAIDRWLPDKPRYFNEIYKFSNPGLILPVSNSPAAPPPVLGPEPEHGWCYAFEKAELARQQGDWEQIAVLGDQAAIQNQTFTRKNVIELAPFIEAYARVGRWEEATRLTDRAYHAWENASGLLCSLWERVRQSEALDADGQMAYTQAQTLLQCPGQ